MHPPKIILIHGWESGPQDAWLPWITKQLTERGFSVIAPEMPDPSHPTIETWVDRLREVVGEPDSQTFFIGHSIGCQAILRFLETVGAPVGGAVFVGGWLTLTTDEFEPEDLELAKPWLDQPIDEQKIQRILPHSTAIFSDNDYFVPTENAELFSNAFGSKSIMLSGYGHFARHDHCTELPIAVEELDKIIEKAG